MRPKFNIYVRRMLLERLFSTYIDKVYVGCLIVIHLVLKILKPIYNFKIIDNDRIKSNMPLM